jgi:hypothetical protein
MTTGIKQPGARFFRSPTNFITLKIPYKIQNIYFLKKSNITAAAVGLGVIFGSADGAEVLLTLGTPLQFGVDRWSTPFEI